jgi:hypothetical protein
LAFIADSALRRPLVPRQHPTSRAWFTNLRASPYFTFHLKHDVRADLPATAIVITDKTAGHGILGVIVNEAQRRGQLQPPVPLEDWIAGSPPVEFL